MKLSRMLVSAAIVASASACADGYQVHALPQDPTWFSSWASAINAAGTVVGAANVLIGYDTFGFPVTQTRAVVWAYGAFAYLPGIVAPAQYRLASQASSINASGLIVGEAQSLNNTVAASWIGGSLSQLTSSNVHAPSTSANAVNDSGVIVGTGGSAQVTAVVFRGGLALPVSLSSGATASGGALFDVNARGIAVGYVNTGSPPLFLGDQSSVTNWAVVGDTATLAVTRLPPLADGSHASAYRISDAGLVVGMSYDASNTSGHAVLWRDGVPTLLDGGLNAASSIATGVDAAGVITGVYRRADNVQRGFIWRDGNATDLLGLVEGGANNWLTIGATDMTETGILVGYAESLSGRTMAVFLTPVPEPTSLMLFLVGGIALLWLITRGPRGRCRRISA